MKISYTFINILHKMNFIKNIISIKSELLSYIYIFIVNSEIYMFFLLKFNEKLNGIFNIKFNSLNLTRRRP